MIDEGPTTPTGDSPRRTTLSRTSRRRYSYVLNASGVSTDQVGSITTSDGVSVTNTFDGFLKTKTLVGLESVTGSVNWTYDDFFRPSTLQVSGAPAITFAYDPDSLYVGTSSPVFRSRATWRVVARRASVRVDARHRQRRMDVRWLRGSGVVHGEDQRRDRALRDVRLGGHRHAHRSGRARPHHSDERDHQRRDTLVGS